MRRGSRNPNENPGVKPVEKIELPEKVSKKRVVLVAVLLVVGLAFIAFALVSWLSKGNGWTEIQPTQASAQSVSGDFIFQYELGNHAELSATAEHKALAALYGEACSTAYRLFTAEAEFTKVNNLYYINRHVGEEIEVDPALYAAFELFEKHGSRLMYAAPLMIDYKNMFTSDDDVIAAEFDPYKNADIAKFAADACIFIDNNAHVSLQLLGNNKVCLFVSEEYLAFAKENGIVEFINFYPVRNALAIDYVAGVLKENGFTAGNITSYDGFTRDLDTRDISYSYNLFAKVDGKIYSAARFEYTGAKSIVFLRAFSISARDDTYYEYENGDVRHPFVDTADGLCKNSLENLVAYSDGLGCADILLSVLPAYVADSFDSAALFKHSERGVHCIYFDGTDICYDEEGAVLNGIFENENIKFTPKLWH